MSTPENCAAPETRITWRASLRFVGRQLLYSLPFALFFGLLEGGQASDYWLALRASIVFALAIGLAVRANEHWVVRRLFRRTLLTRGEPLRGAALARHVATYAAASVLGAFVGAVIVHFTVLPGFLGGLRQFGVWLAFTILFTTLVMSLGYAIEFQRSIVERARREERMKSELEGAELRALRAQINPHFLFNTLNSIASLIAVDPARAEAVTEELADVFRYALRASERERAPLAEELAFVRSYLDIERARMGERLRVEEDVEAAALGCEIPTLLLQPLVENAVLHGLAPRPEGGRVRIAAATQDGRLEIQVEDDGLGFPAQAGGSDGFGLRSVRERLRVLGTGHDLLIEQPEHGGTRVRVRLPVSSATGTDAR